MVKNPPAIAGNEEMWVGSLGLEDLLEETMVLNSVCELKQNVRQSSMILTSVSSHQLVQIIQDIISSGL